jgi:hypothetical protein
MLAVSWERENREREDVRERKDVRERENIIFKTTPAATAGMVCSILM